MTYQVLDTVVLDRDLPDHGLRKGDHPEKDRSYERRLLLHLSALSSPMASSV